MQLCHRGPAATLPVPQRTGEKRLHEQKKGAHYMGCGLARQKGMENAETRASRGRVAQNRGPFPASAVQQTAQYSSATAGSAVRISYVVT